MGCKVGDCAGEIYVEVSNKLKFQIYIYWKQFADLKPTCLKHNDPKAVNQF